MVVALKLIRESLENSNLLFCKRDLNEFWMDSVIRPAARPVGAAIRILSAEIPESKW